MSEVSEVMEMEDFLSGDALGDAMEDMSDDAFAETGSGFEEVAEEPVATPAKEVPVAQAKTEVGVGLVNFDFSALMSMPGVVTGETGIVVSRFPVERMRFSKNAKSLISILSDQVIVCKTHYEEDLGQFLCFGGECCKHDLAKVRYVYPIMVYTTDAKGKPVSLEIQNKALVLGQSAYNDLLDIQDMNGSLTNMDLLIRCDKEDYQEISITNAGPCRYKTKPQMVKEVQEFWRENSEHILKGIARVITPEDYKKAKAADVTQGSELDMDAVFGN